MLIPRKKKVSGTCTTVNIKTPTTTLFMGMLITKTCKISDEMAQMMVPIISEQFTMIVDITTELLIQLSAYIELTGIQNEKYLSFMTNYIN